MPAQAARTPGRLDRRSRYSLLAPVPLPPPLDAAAAGAAAGAGAAASFDGDAVGPPFDSPNLGGGSRSVRFSLDPLLDEYRSAYQPPPFRMKLAALICRLAVRCEHLGQISTAGSVILWISSHALLQAEQTYS